MDILTIAGILIGISALLGGQLLEGGALGSILQPTAAIIVFGGTLGAVLVSHPFGTFVRAVADTRKAFFNVGHRALPMIEYITAIASKAKVDGLLALEAELDNIKVPFLKRGLQLVIDGEEPDRIRDILDIELQYSEEYSEASAGMFESAGGFAPTIGILGAVLGLIQVMENLAEPDKLGAGIAVAFVATVYGVGSANLLWLPIAEKLKKRVREESIIKELIIEGLMGLSIGENPRRLKEKLNGFMKKSEKVISEAGGF
jgi:chemotaxis protein MotA